MTEPSGSRFKITVADLRAYDWQARIDQHPTKECSSYSIVLSLGIQECASANDELGVRVFSFLRTVCSFRLNYDTFGNPLGPETTDLKERTLMAEDLTAADLAVLGDILDEIRDPELRARVGDILWECTRNYKAAQTAIRSYIESGRRLETPLLWPTFVERLERALHMGATLGFGKALHQEAIAEVEAAIGRYEFEPRSGILCGQLMQLLLNHEAGDPVRYGALSEMLANRLVDTRNWDFAEKYWRIAEQWMRKVDDDAAAQRCRLAACETLISKAQEQLAISPPNFGTAAHWMGRGVEALRRARADRTRISKLHAQFLEIQKKSLSELKSPNLPMERVPGLLETQEKAIAGAAAHVRGHLFRTAVGCLAFVTRPTDVAALRKSVEDNAGQYLFPQLFETIALDGTGKVADTAPATTFANSEAREEGIRKQMLQRCAMTDWPLRVEWSLEPARKAIVEEHAVRMRDLAFLVKENPFVPAGHEGFYLRGIQAGFLGDWVLAMHLLIPQIEASLRSILQQHGIVTSTLESDRVQEERDLGWLITHAKTEELLGADLVFDLRGIMIERFGHNLRNRTAHGLITEGGFYHPGAVYIWWLTILLCWQGHRALSDQSELD